MAGFNTVLIANRGEIALRVMRTARAMGYATVAVYSDADRGMPHVVLADRAVPIGPAPAAESYLSIPRIIEAAKRSGADAVHPGYGFLSENADFADACAAAGLVFIGPPALAIRLMGNKAAAKRRMAEAGVPCVPGYQGEDQSDARLIRAAGDIGYPVMVKAAAGGGGKGMRVVTDGTGLAEALRAARSELLKAFGSEELILERAIAAPRHVEIQVFGDAHGNVIHLGERDCSLQRRHQKVIEEAPCPVISPNQRGAMGEAAVAASRAIGYVGAGTVEFLLAPDGRFHFLEMNTRLQVEHPVTEMITGLDLVEWQLRVAAGEPLPLRQEDVAPYGHAIEARLYAEDTANGFLPAAGTLLAWEPSEDVRVDHGMAPGVAVSPHYDPLLAKLIAYGATREEARRRLVAALRDTVALGIATNRDFLIACLEHAAFVASEVSTAFIDTHMQVGTRKPDARMLALAAALIAELTRYDANEALSYWSSTGVSATPLLIRCDHETMSIAATGRGGRRYRVAWAGEDRDIEIRAASDNRVRFLSGGIEETAQFAWNDGELHLSLGGITALFEDVQLSVRSAPAGTEGDVALAPMTGTIAAVRVKAGDAVDKGECLVILEAMKMEHQVVAPRRGTIAAILVAPGEQVKTRKRLVELVPLAAE